MSSVKKDVCIQFGYESIYKYWCVCVSVYWPRSFRVEEIPTEDEVAPAEREWKFIEKDAFSDLKLIVKDKEFFCHKIMLSNCSPVFRAMLLGNFSVSSFVSVGVSS